MKSLIIKKIKTKKLNKQELLSIHQKYVENGKEKKIIAPHEIEVKKSIETTANTQAIKEEVEATICSTNSIEVKENKKNDETLITPRNPFKMFLDNISGKSRELANTVIKEKDEIFSKFNNSKSPTSIDLNSTFIVSSKEFVNVHTQTDIVYQSDENISNLNKIAQLNSELIQKSEYLEKSETKIIQLKSDLQSANEQIRTLVSDFSNLSSLIEQHRSRITLLESQLAESTNHNNFLKLELQLHESRKTKILKSLPEHLHSPFLSASNDFIRLIEAK